MRSDNAETGWVVPDDGKTDSGTELSKLGKKDLGADGATAVQAKSNRLVSGATVTLNCRRKSMLRIGPAMEGILWKEAQQEVRQH